ncbi:hypothetical protein Acy02nite_04090 [Actinoplanes cyaneus]|uniref:Secreted protein n=1 Tax=Actinoplanes cyaneus TaxID=52696 RepID=A0A919M2V0_9ACTN|nr:hypothetical protein [Actinoplanes cyaneus]MCW2136103.1 hypothetical protein [Actinoplanes cyaneus]GID62528.1 hypothetical protein Acy02nite_04090 [Actinoplanes cyaneus]
MTADLSFEQLAQWIEQGRVRPIADALTTMGEPARRALGRRLPELTAVRMPCPEGMDQHAWWRLMDRRNAAMRVAGAGCLTGASKVVSWLRNFGTGDDPALAATVIQVLGAPGRPSLAAVARGMATRLRPNQVDLQWRLISRLLDAAGEPVPPTEATLLGWLRETGCSAESLRADSRTAYLLPHVFTIPRLGGEVSPGGLANLTEQRAVVLDGCVHRLAEGDRPGAIRSFVQLHRLLAPTPDELAEHRQTYLGMLDSPHSTVVDVAQRALHGVDDPGLVADASLSVLPRTEKKLVRAQLAWADTVLAAKPDPVLFEALLTGLTNESVDLAERTVRVIAKHVANFDTAALAQVAEGLTGDLRRQVAALLPADPVRAAAGTTRRAVAGTPGGPAGFAGTPAEPMPAALRSVPEVVAVVGTLLDQADRDPVLLEQALDGLVRFAHQDRAGLAVALAPKTPHWPDPFSRLLRAVVEGTWTPWRPDSWEQWSSPPFWMLVERLGEIGRLMTGSPPPALLATPATVDGHVDPARVLDLLVTADQDGWQPGPFDLSQAVLRLPRTIGPEILAGAERLVSPAGRFFATWLRGGGLPDPTVVVGEAVWHRCSPPEVCTCRRPRRVRWISSFEPPTLPVPVSPAALPPPADPPMHVALTPDALPAPPEPTGLRWTTPGPPRTPDDASREEWPAAALPALAVPEGLLGIPVDRGRTPKRRHNESVVAWPMVLPGHPEIIAAHALPEILGAIDGDDRFHLGVLPVLAASTGPSGPATALCVALGLSADQAPGRVFATDAFVDLAVRGKLDAALVGRELADLHRGGRVTVKRVAACLTEAVRAGLAAEVWATAREMLPAVLADPGPGTPDLLAVAEAAAAVEHATDDLPELSAGATRPGRNRLITEAARLARTLADNRSPAPA